jgi:hypothetical protein
MDDMYWSIERCGWAPCQGERAVSLTPWDAEETPAPPLPQQRLDEPAPVDA